MSSSVIIGSVAGVVGVGLLSGLGFMAYRSMATAEEERREREAERELQARERELLLAQQMAQMNNQPGFPSSTTPAVNGGGSNLANVLGAGATLASGLGSLISAFGSL